MFIKRLNSPGKRAAFAAAVASLIAAGGFIVAAPPLTISTEKVTSYEVVQGKDPSDAWRIEKRCADEHLPKSSFSHEFWVVWAASSDRPQNPDDSRLSISDAIGEVYVRRADAQDPYFISEQDLTRVREKLIDSIHRCTGSMCARSIDKDLLQEIVEKCGAKANISMSTRWHLERNPDFEGVPQKGLYVSGAVLILFLMLSIGYDQTIGRVLAWIKDGNASK